ncbi:Rieske (2Fe-2S) protein [Acinetobacter gerneri]|jgi:nitrite reductase/ring-hydroxylating ferredoxin subunit|uniref:Rieske (2Fe-2S) protein n=1 Tax=Acinetobacter gerneri TaxID=202952 RepID=UPI0023F36072|nr:Rieske 2Fe-2S domain-containing protein [Acinetobacter gerneri]MCH4243415.1 Rieske 2Fe-2S domain-containing protein [Acinetobacter gerneri]
MDNRIKLCEIDSFSDRDVLKVEHPFQSEKTVVIIKKNGQYYSYENVCPHFSVQLDYRSGQFSIYKNEVIMCAHHSALFDIETGLCIDGPCKGQHLVKIDHELIGQQLFFK